jgi:Tol biopolymer transport system component
MNFALNLRCQIQGRPQFQETRMAEVQEPCAPVCPVEIPGYQLLDKIGEGGTGEVHRATQLSLGRTVAVKLLTPQGGEQTARLALERESRAMAALAHPHVVTIHDCGQIQGRWYLVVEYMDGKALRGRMEPGKPVPVDRAASMLDAISRALSYIHERGILHLDLKPENVLCTTDGTVKITDFGLAAPHISMRGPRALEQCEGSLDYCSPEQRYGLPVDCRSDVFSLAALAYELLTGHLPSRVYVPATERNPRLPRAVNPVLEKGLARDADERYASPEAFRQDLLRALGVFQKRTRRWPSWAAMAAALLIGLSFPSWWQGSDATPEPPPPLDPVATLLRPTPFAGKHEILYPCVLMGRSSLFLLRPDAATPVNLTKEQRQSSMPAYSPDGKSIAFTCDVDGKPNICVMDVGGGNFKALTTGHNRAPAWSPDGKRIVFVSKRDGNSEVYVMDRDGSNQTNLSNDPSYDGDPAWSPDGKQIAFVSNRGERKRFALYVMDPDGNNVRDLMAPVSTAGYVYPAWSPDGKKIAYAGAGPERALEIFLCDPLGKQHEQLTRLGGSNGLPAWSPDGKRIAFQHTAPGEQVSSLYIIDADGTNAVMILAAAGQKEGGRPAWKPK